MTTPVIRGLHLQKGYEVHVLTKESFKGILQYNPYISQILTIKKTVKEVESQLRSENYDIVVDLHKNIRSKQAARIVGATRVTFDKLNWQKWFLVNFKRNKLPDIHIVDRYLAAVDSLGIVNDGDGLDYFTKEDSREIVEPYIVYAIGGQHSTKRMPTEKLISVCKKLEKEFPIVFIGGKEDVPAGEILSKALSKRNYFLIGQRSIEQSTNLIRYAECVITHDTGMMHIASALQKPIVSVWGNTVPEFGMYPYLKNERLNTIVQVEGLSCRPCSKIGFDKCPKGHFKCMNDIDESSIFENVKNLTKEVL